MNDWLIRLDVKVDIPTGNQMNPPVSGLATLGDDFHDGVGSHVQIGRAAEARKRLDAAFERLSQLKLYPAQQIKLGSEAD